MNSVQLAGFRRNRCHTPYYDPTIGCYINADPIGLNGGINLYAYVLNPLSAIDPFGLSTMTLGGGSRAAAAAAAAGGSLVAAGKAAAAAVAGSATASAAAVALAGAAGYFGTRRLLKDTPLGNGAFGDWLYDKMHPPAHQAENEGSEETGCPDENADEGEEGEELQVTPDGIVLPEGMTIPDNYVENPHGREGSYGEMEDGRFRERIRIDPATPPGKKGPDYSHYHKNGKGTHYSPRPGDKNPGF